MKSPAAGDSTLTVQADPAPWRHGSGRPRPRIAISAIPSGLPQPLQAGTTIPASIAKPATGYLAAFAELEYLIDGIPYHLTTTFFEPGLRPRQPNFQNR